MKNHSDDTSNISGVIFVKLYICAFCQNIIAQLAFQGEHFWLLWQALDTSKDAIARQPPKFMVRLNNQPNVLWDVVSPVIVAVTEYSNIFSRL